MRIGGKMKKFKAIAAAAALIAAALVPTTAANAALVIPRTAWAACSEVKVTYCVESATIQAVGSITEDLTFTPVAGSTYGGYWTTATWATDHASNTYAGLIFEVKPANQFSNHLSFTAYPSTAEGKIAEQEGKAGYQVSLNPDEIISFKARIGEVLPGVAIGVGTAINIARAPGVITITGTPVEVAEAANIRQCSTEDGVASADSYQLSAYVIVENDDQGFGVDGLTGAMNITSNGTCAMSTPSWNSATGELTWVASAPHYKSDGTTLNYGVYRAVIPAADAAVLWGLTRPQDAVSALTVSVTNDGTGRNAAIRKVAFKGGNIIIEHSGFQYSKNTFKIKKKSTYKKFSALKTRTCKQIKPALPGPNVLRQKAGACPAGYKG